MIEIIVLSLQQEVEGIVSQQSINNISSMRQQKQRIAEFLDGIIDSSLPAEQQIMLFSEEGVEGAGAAQNQ